jgi:hypothetical protein
MPKKFFIISQLVLISVLYSCKVYKPVVPSASQVQSAEDYLNIYKDVAISEMIRTGVPASITLAQGMIESDFGRSRLAREGNNHFGIKCHNDWRGPTIIHTDDNRNECFRKYLRPEESFYDHSDFLRSVPRYSFLFGIDPADYKGWARGLKNAGYATNPDYANMLIRKIEENNLWQFDRGNNSVSQSSHTVTPVKDTVTVNTYKVDNQVPVQNVNPAVYARGPRVMETNRIQYIIVKDWDTREGIEKEFQLLRWELPKYNELNTDFEPVPGQILYLQPKKERAEPGKEFHTVKEGETMYQISQKYGIKLKSLYAMNRMSVGTESEAGKKLWLRIIKPVN